MRSVPAGSFERLTSFQALWSAFRRYGSGKSRRPSVAEFSVDADRRLLALHRELVTGSYRPGRYRIQVIQDPKTRLIAAPPIRDRILQQSLVDEVAPWYERGFIDDHYACRTGRGPQRAVLRYLQWTRRYRWRLNLDIRRYFPSIHRSTLADLIERRLRDAGTKELVRRILASGEAVYADPKARKVLNLEAEPLPPGSGIPIGSYLSQWAAALYLDGFDHFAKRELKARAYARYMDDVVLFSNDRGWLEETREASAAWLARERRLELNPKRGRVLPTAQPSIFLGYRVTRAGIGPSKKLLRGMRRRLRELEDDPERIYRSLLSYRGWCRFG